MNQPFDPETTTRLRELASLRREYAKLRDAAETKYDETGAEIGMILTLHGLEKADLGDYRVSLTPGGRSTLDGTILSQLLLERGTPLDVITASIAEATRKTHSTSVRVTEVKEK